MKLVSKTIKGRGKGPRLLICAGVHGDEFEPMGAVRGLMERVRAEGLRGTLTLVPVVNEGAFLRGERTAEDGLDLARTCPGKVNGSVTERAAAALTAMIRGADFFIDLHTGGRALALVPLAGYMLHPDDGVLEAQRRMALAFNLPLIWGTTPNLEGRSLSAARDANVPAIYVEHGGGGAFDAAATDDLLQGCLNVMATLGMMRIKSKAIRVKHVVEDAREQSGYLQINYPCPMEGMFEPAARLGGMIRKGGVIGAVRNPISGKSAEVKAKVSGMVAMLRVFPWVSKGDSLAAIIDGITAERT